MNNTELQEGAVREAQGWYCVKCGVYNDLQSRLCAGCEDPNPLLAVLFRQRSQSSFPTEVETPKRRAVYMLLGLLFGYLGFHNFYIKRNAEGNFQFFVSLFLFWTIVLPIIMYFWSLVEVFTVKTDGSGNPLR